MYKNILNNSHTYRHHTECNQEQSLKMQQKAAQLFILVVYYYHKRFHAVDLKVGIKEPP